MIFCVNLKHIFIFFSVIVCILFIPYNHHLAPKEDYRPLYEHLYLSLDKSQYLVILSMENSSAIKSNYRISEMLGAPLSKERKNRINLYKKNLATLRNELNHEHQSDNMFFGM